MRTRVQVTLVLVMVYKVVLGVPLYTVSMLLLVMKTYLKGHKQYCKYR